MQLRTRLIIAILLASSSAVFSQKQTENLPAPAVVKIDGKINEWTSPFQINKPTKLSYIIANDARNLYLVIKSEDSLVNSRILLTGIDFMVNTAGKKKEGPFIMFPYIQRAPRTRGAGAGAQLAAAPLVPLADLIVAHRKAIADIKEIKLSGFKDVTDETISIYNEYGIKGAAAFDDKDYFLYELAIPLNVLGLTAESGQEVAYNIKINGSEGLSLRGTGGGGGFGGDGGGRGTGGGGGSGGFGGGGGGSFGGGGFGGDRGGNNNNRVNQNRFYEPTDFWVTYKLTKPQS